MGAPSPSVEHRAPPVHAGGRHQEGESKDPTLPHPQSCSRPTLRTPVHEPTAHGLPWLVSCGEGASIGSSNATPRCQCPRPIQPTLTDSGFLLGILWDLLGFLGASEALLATLVLPILQQANLNHCLEQASNKLFSQLAAQGVLVMALCLVIKGVITILPGASPNSEVTQ